MRIAVLGAAGQLGRALGPRLPGDVIPLSRAEMDLARPESISATLAATCPELFVNCAAYNLVDRAETEHDAAFAANAWGVRELARACAIHGIPLVHYSTDYVFGLDRTRTLPFTETDAPGPVSVYGLSKLAGEYFALAASPRNLVIRTCGLYGLRGVGGKGGNFVETMLRLGGAGKVLRVVNDQHCTPSYTVDVAAASVALIRAGANGLFHVTNAGSCTWYELAAEIFRQAGLKPNLTPIPSSERRDPAMRPAFSVLSNAKLAASGIPALRSWQEAVAASLAERQG
jgi:dTDP-4-dehydrorhamnose reductase